MLYLWIQIKCEIVATRGGDRMAGGWRFTKLSLSSALLRIVRACFVFAPCIRFLFAWVSCAFLHLSYLFWHLRLYQYFLVFCFYKCSTDIFLSSSRYTKLSLSSVLLGVARVLSVCTMHPFFISWVPCASLHPTHLFSHLLLYVCMCVRVCFFLLIVDTQSIKANTTHT